MSQFGGSFTSQIPITCQSSKCSNLAPANRNRDLKYLVSDATGERGKYLCGYCMEYYRKKTESQCGAYSVISVVYIDSNQTRMCTGKPVIYDPSTRHFINPMAPVVQAPPALPMVPVVPAFTSVFSGSTARPSQGDIHRAVVDGHRGVSGTS